MILAISFLVIFATIVMVLYVIKRLRNAKPNATEKTEASVYTLDELRTFGANRRESAQAKNDFDNNSSDGGDGGGD